MFNQNPATRYTIQNLNRRFGDILRNGGDMRTMQHAVRFATLVAKQQNMSLFQVINSLHNF